MNIKTVLLILLSMLVFSCNEKKKENINTSLVKNEPKTEINKNLKKTEVVRDSSKTKKVVIRDSSFFCNINYANILQKNIGNPDEKDIKNFLLTFDKSCSSNIEYGEYSNELLFEILNRNTKSVIDILSDNNNLIDISFICQELESPINDAIDLKKLSKNIIDLDTDKEVKIKLISALSVALEKYD